MPVLDVLHAEKPLRVWSLIVTIFGDVVMRQGRDLAPGPIWTGRLMELLALMGVEAGPARTSLSRLVASGVLDRDKIGRNTFHRLSAASATEFAAAAETIYARRSIAPTGRLLVALLDRASDRAAARTALEADGWRFLSASAAMRPEHDGGPGTPPPQGVITAVAALPGEAVAAARALWRIDALQTAYAEFIDRFGRMESDLTPEQAMIARIVMVHRMRRLELRDPILPAAVLPADWAGDAARKLFARHLATLNAPSERWLAETRFRSGATD